VAVRSSAVGEDSVRASFAGQHLTRLNVTGDVLAAAITDVWRSGRSESALVYRRRLAVDGVPRVGVVIQVMIDAECAGVLFTRNPVDGRDEHRVPGSVDRTHPSRGDEGGQLVGSEPRTRLQPRSASFERRSGSEHDSSGRLAEAGGGPLG
jgi:hypothetical protein